MPRTARGLAPAVVVIPGRTTEHTVGPPAPPLQCGIERPPRVGAAQALGVSFPAELIPREDGGAHGGERCVRVKEMRPPRLEAPLGRPEHARTQPRKEAEAAEWNALLRRHYPALVRRQFQPHPGEPLRDAVPQRMQRRFVVGEDQEVIRVARIRSEAQPFGDPVVERIEKSDSTR